MTLNVIDRVIDVIFRSWARPVLPTAEEVIRERNMAWIAATALARSGMLNGDVSQVAPAHNWDDTRRALVHALDIPALESEPVPTWMEIIDTARRRTEAAKSRPAPAVTAEQVDTAARAAWDVDAPMTNEGRQQFDRIVSAAQEAWRERVRAAFRAVGIAVKP